MSDNKKNKYADYLPENRARNQRIGLSVNGSRVILVFFIVFLVVMFFYLGKDFGDGTVSSVESRYYNLNLTESINLDSIYSDPNVIWEADNNNVVIEGNLVTAVSPGKVYIIGRIGNKQVTDINITVLGNGRTIYIEDHDMEINSSDGGKIIVNQRENVNSSGGNNSNGGNVNVSNNPNNNPNLYFEDDKRNDEFDNVDVSNNNSNGGTVVKDNSNLVYESSNTNVAVVDNEGNVKPVSEGTTVITVKDSNGNEDHTYVTVTDVPDLTVTILEYSLKVGDSTSIDYSVNEKKYRKNQVSFTSSDGKVATVDGNGKISAKGKGNAVIDVKLGNTTKKVRVSVSENVVLPTDISINNDSLTLVVGDSGKINASVVPSNASSLYLSYKSSNSNVAVVDGQGNVSAKGAGDAIITITTSNNISKTVKVKVNRRVVEATGISFNQSNLKLKVGETAKISYTITPVATTDKTVTYEFDRNYVSLDSSGNLKALRAGVTEVTVKTVNGRSAKLRVEITSPVKLASDIKINEGNIKIAYGSSKQLSLTINPSDASRDGLAWKSSNPSIASVDNNGKVTAKAAGHASISVTLNGKSSSIDVEVASRVVPVTGVTVNQSSLNLKVGNSATVKAEVNPSNATNKNVIWKSSNDSVAMVDSNGKVTAYGKGSAVISAIAGDNSAIKANVNVTVTYDVKLILEYSAKTLEEGTSFVLQSRVTPAQANQGVTFESSNNSVATIDNNGKITAKSAGTAIITATSVEDKSKKEKCTVTVKAKAVLVDGNIVGATGYAASNSGINLRSKDTSSSTNLGNIKAGEPFKIIGTNSNDTWWKVNYNGKVGYVYNGYCMINLPDYIPSMSFDIKNASFVTDTSAGHKFPATYGKKLYSAGKVYNKRLGRDEYIVPVVYTFAKRLLIAQKQALKENYSILVYDAYRPTDVAKKSREDMLYLYNHYADVKKAVTYSYHNGVTYTWGWDWFIADGVSMHSYGVAVDVTLVSTKGKTVKMPTEFAVCDTSAIKYYRPIGKQSTVRTDLYASTMTQDAKNLDRIMLTGTGLSSLASEWWHFQDLASKNTIASIDPAGLHFHPTKIVSDKS